MTEVSGSLRTRLLRAAMIGSLGPLLMLVLPKRLDWLAVLDLESISLSLPGPVPIVLGLAYFWWESRPMLPSRRDSPSR